MRFIQFISLKYQKSSLTWMESSLKKDGKTIAILVAASKNKKEAPSVLSLTTPTGDLRRTLNIEITTKANERRKNVPKSLLTVVSAEEVKKLSNYFDQFLPSLPANTILIEDVEFLKEIMEKEWKQIPDNQVHNLELFQEKKSSVQQTPSVSNFQTKVTFSKLVPPKGVQFNSLDGIWQQLSPSGKVKFESQNESQITAIIHKVFDQVTAKNKQASYQAELNDLLTFSTPTCIICSESLLQSLFGYKYTSINHSPSQQTSLSLRRGTIIPPEKSNTVLHLIEQLDNNKSLIMPLIYIFNGLQTSGITWTADKEDYFYCINDKDERQLVVDELTEKIGKHSSRLPEEQILPEEKTTFYSELMQIRTLDNNLYKTECAKETLIKLLGEPRIIKLSKSKLTHSTEIKKITSPAKLNAFREELVSLLNELKKHTESKTELVEILDKVCATSKEDLKQFSSNKMNIQLAFIKIRQYLKGETTRDVYALIEKDQLINETYEYFLKALNELKTQIATEDLHNKMNKKYPPYNTQQLNNTHFLNTQTIGVKRQLSNENFFDNLKKIKPTNETTFENSKKITLTENDQEKFMSDVFDFNQLNYSTTL